VKTPEQVLLDIERRLARTWADTVTVGAQPGEPAWPHPFPRGQPFEFEAQRPAVAARGLAEAENELASFVRAPGQFRLLAA